MKQSVLVRLAILALVAAVGSLVLVFTIPEPPVSKRSFARIGRTMTEKDLMAFLGPANGDEFDIDAATSQTAVYEVAGTKAFIELVGDPNITQVFVKLFGPAKPPPPTPLNSVTESMPSGAINTAVKSGSYCLAMFSTRMLCWAGICS